MLSSWASFAASSALGVLTPMCSSSNLQAIRVSFLSRNGFSLHGEDQDRAGGQGQQADEVLGNGKLPELADLVVAGAHDHGGHTVDGQEVSAPARDDDGGSRGRGVKAQVQAGGDGHGGKDVDGADGGTGQGGQDAGQDAEHEDQDEGVDVVAQ